MPRQVAERLEPSDDSSGASLIDYSEKRSLPISIPDYQNLEERGEKFIVSFEVVSQFTEGKAYVAINQGYALLNGNSYQY